MIKNSIIAALLGALVVVVGIACTSLAPADAGTCAAPTSGQTGCVLPILARGITGSWDVALTQAQTSCGVSKETASSLWASHAQAEVLEGFVPRAIGVDGGIHP